MDIVKSLLSFIKQNDQEKASKTPAGICPNCWGREEYGGHFYKRLKQENLNSHSQDSNVGWINAYANKNLKGIALRREGNGETLVCESCKVSYQHSDIHTDA
ncbi:MAG: hypothetical protein P8M34_15610 [Saprospiraceae bacterium]|nr:hypothetical protein [Saprospiraceae bacterium]|tara:strand:- start:930 stop:1235 length:306 start_codon:yes stop_codon:yes gene_type:complete